MERLTRRSDTGHAYYPRCFEEPCIGAGCKIKDCLLDDIICDRLAAYEDTGLEPEEVLPKDKADEIALKLMRLVDLESICSYTRLRELAEADKDERVVVLPCKVGDVVYGFHGEKTILPMVAKWIETNTDGWCIEVQYAPMAPRFYRFSDFGKTVFLTREEAEKALEAMK
nr:MAG TPA: hypothetical protein [Caudoviricetes sp.]